MVLAQNDVCGLLDKDTVLKDYLECVESINDSDIRFFVQEALDDAPNEFWETVASVSRRNHPPEDNLPRGLLIHTIKALEVAEELFRFFGVFDETERDIIRASVLLHDLYKQGHPWGKFTDREHGKICANILNKYTLNSYIKRKIQLCIETHMSRWAYPMESLKAFIIPDKLQMITALSDYIASRNNISFYPGISIFETN